MRCAARGGQGGRASPFLAPLAGSICLNAQRDYACACRAECMHVPPRSAREVGKALGVVAIKSTGALKWPRRKVCGAADGPVIVLGVIHHGWQNERFGERDWAEKRHARRW